MVARFRIAWTSGAVTGLAVSTVYSNAIDQSSADVFGDALQTFVTGVVAEVGGAGLKGQVESLADQIDPATGNVLDQWEISPPAGGQAALSAVGSKASQALIRFRTGTFVAGRRIQGHIFIPAIQVSSITANGDLSATAVSGINDEAAILLGTGNVVVYSRTHHTAAAVTSISTTSTLAVLRSRRD